jgi:hypothetical protein
MRIDSLNFKARESVWIWLIGGLGLWLVLELGPFFIASSVLEKSAGELVGPYLAFAIPWVITAPLIWWLRRREELGASPKMLAHGWGMSMALFVLALAIAVFYSGVKLRLMTRSDAVISFTTMSLFGGLILYLIGYHRALKVLSSRDADKPGRG